MLDFLSDYADYLIGGLVILFFAYNRFNTPVGSRSSTTAFRYHTAACAYAFLTLGVWLLVIGTGGILLPDVKMVDLESPILGALLITGLLPHTPGLDKLDQWVRGKLHGLAAIPHEVRRLSSLLRDSAPDLPQDLQGDTEVRMQQLGFDGEDVVFEPNGSPEYAWTRLTALMVRLRGWRTQARRGPFLGSLDEWHQLEAEYNAMVPKARTFFSIMRQLSRKPDERYEEVGREYRAVFLEQADDLYGRACKVTSRVILGCYATQSAREEELARAGFKIEARSILTLDQVVAVFLLVFFVMAPVMAFASTVGDPSHFPRALAISLMVSLIYSAAVVCSVYPRERWSSWAKRNGRNLRPWRFYLVAGVMASMISGVLSLGTRILLESDWEHAWDGFLMATPWTLMAFTTAFTLAFLCDDEPSKSMPTIRWRLLEGGVAMMVLMVASLLVRLSLVSLDAASVPSLPRVLTLTGVIGFFLGFFVPTWYREPQGELPVALTGAERHAPA